jgi:hypothetical protein
MMLAMLRLFWFNLKARREEREQDKPDLVTRLQKLR